MADLYKRENPFISTVVEPSMSVSEKSLKTVDIEATRKIVDDIDSPEVKRGNPNKALNLLILDVRGN